MRKVQSIISVIASAVMIVITCSSSAQVKPTPATERMKSIQQRKALQNASLVNNIPFRNIGPTQMSGRVDDIEANPDDPTEFYVAYATGGLWYTNNNGQSFTSIFDSADIITIGDIAVNWKTRTIWVGTGEVNSSRSSYSGIGVYKSNNNGRSWEYLGLPESQHIGKIQLHPTDPNTAWVAVLGHLYSPNKERGVYKTTDGGKTWKQTLAVDENTGAVEMDINPTNPNELYAATWYRTRRAWEFVGAGKTSAIYKSVDGGETWMLSSTAASGFPTGDSVGRIGIAVAPNKPNVVYAVVDNQRNKPDTGKKDTSRYNLKQFENISKEAFAMLDDKKLDTFFKDNGMSRRYTAKQVKEMVATGKIESTDLYKYLNVNTGFEVNPIGCEVYRSDDAGKTWRKVNEKEIPIFFSYGYYFAKIFVSPLNENKVYVLGLDPMMSADGGKSFKVIDQQNVHSDHHALWIDPKRDNHLINGNDGGIYITYDDGGAWFHANSPAVGQFYAITVDMAKPYNVYGGLQDNGVWYFPSVLPRNYSPLWSTPVEKSIGGGDGMQVQVDTRDNATAYLGSQFGSYVRTNRNTREGTKRITPQHNLGDYPYRFNWQTPILLSRHTPEVLYFGSNKLHRSLNKADTMFVMSGDLTNGSKNGNVPYGTITAIDESPLRFGLLYVGTDDGNIHVTKDGGYSWTKISSRLPQNLWVSRVTASAFKEGRVYATLNGYRFDNFSPYLYVSEDYGNSWKQIGKDLPNEPLNVIREDNKYDSILYVGTDGGLYVSLNQGNGFMMWNNGLPASIPVHDIAVHPRESEIILGTHGRSVYIAKLDSVQLLLKNTNYRSKRESQKGTTQGNTESAKEKSPGRNEREAEEERESH